MDDDLVADLHVGNVFADGVDDAGRIGAADVEVLDFPGLLAGGDDIDGEAETGPDVVVVDARRHHVDERVVGTDGGDIDDLGGERLEGFAEAGLADELGVTSAPTPRRAVALRRGGTDRYRCRLSCGP